MAVGHVTLDLTDDGRVAGGAGLYASVTASRLGWSSGLVTRGAPTEAGGFLGSLDMVVDEPSGTTTTFDIRYLGEARRVELRSLASPIRGERLPDVWGGAEVVMLSPVFREVKTSMVSRFAGALLGVAPQGWLRRTAAEGRVVATEWFDGEVLERTDVVVLSEMDVTDGRIPEGWLEHDGIFVLTRGRRGAVMRHEGRWYEIPAYPAREVDPTGAGDVFAAAFLIRYFESKDAFSAGVFASCAASMKVEGTGAGAIPTRDQVQQRMNCYPDMKVEECQSVQSDANESGVLKNDV